MPKFYVPADLDLESLVKEQKRPDVRRNLIYGCAYVLNHFYTYPKTLKGKDIFEKTGGGVPITMTILRENIGSKTADKAISLLLEKGEIEIVGEYVPQFGLSRLYAHKRLNSNWIQEEFARSIFQKSSKIRNEVKVDSQDGDTLSFLKYWLINPSLTLDLKSLDFFVQFFYNKIYHLLPNVLISYTGQKKKEYVLKLENALNSRFHEVVDKASSFEKNAGLTSRSTSNKRFNTVLTNLIKPVRYFLKFGDMNLYEIDITASQPFLFFIVLQRLKVQKKATNTINTNPSASQPTSTSKLHHMLSTFSEAQWKQLDAEILVFESFYKNGSGDFYENLGLKIRSGEKNRIYEFENRSKSKNSFIYLLFEKFEGKKKGFSVYKAFRREFPMILSIMDAFKFEEKKALAIALQTMEAEIVLDKIARVFSEKFPGVPIYSIHDALLTIESHKEKLNDLMIQILWEEAGIKPSTKVTKLCPEALFEDLSQTLEDEFEELKKKVRRKNKLVMNLGYRFFKLFNNEIPHWNSESVETISVWSQVKNNPKHSRIIVPRGSDLSVPQNADSVHVSTIFKGDHQGKKPSDVKLEKGYVVPPLFEFEGEK